MAHLGMKPRTTAIGQKEQNGTVEAQNGPFKRYLNQRLQARGSREFASVDAFDGGLVENLAKENSRRPVRLQEELAVMKPREAEPLTRVSGGARTGQPQQHHQHPAQYLLGAAAADAPSGAGPPV
jgi:hypothetical protein